MRIGLPRTTRLAKSVSGSSLACVLVFAAPASAVSLAGAELSVERALGADDCPDEASLAQSVQGLGTPPAAAAAASTESWRVEVVFAIAPAEYVGTIRSTGRKPGVREIRVRSNTCASLAETTSVALAILLDLLPEPAVESEPAVAVPVRRVPEDAPAAAAPPGRPGSLGAGVTSGVAFGLLGAAFSAVIGGGVGLAGERGEIALGALFGPSRHIDHAPGSVEVGLTLLRLDACWSWQPRKESGPLACLGIAAGWLHGVGEGFDEDYDVVRPWIAGGGGFFFRGRLTDRVALRFGLSALVPVHRQVFSVSGAGQAFETPPAALLFELGPELTIW